MWCSGTRGWHRPPALDTSVGVAALPVHFTDGETKTLSTHAPFPGSGLVKCHLHQMGLEHPLLRRQSMAEVEQPPSGLKLPKGNVWVVGGLAGSASSSGSSVQDSGLFSVHSSWVQA